MHNFIFALFIVSILFTGCFTPKNLNTPLKVEVNSHFKGDSSTTQKDNVKLPEWRSYFKDEFLVALIDTAIKRNPDYQVALQRLYIAQQQSKLAKLSVLPSVNLGAGAGVVRFGDYTIDGVGNFDTNFSPNLNQNQRIPNPVPDFALGVNASWEIGLSGKIHQRKKAALYRFLKTEQGRIFMKTQLVANTAMLYYELLAVDAELEIIQKNIDLQNKAFEIVEIQKQSGRINELAVKQFEAQTLQARSYYFIKKQQQTELENALNNLLGRYPQKIERKSGISTSDLPQELQIGVPSDLLKNRPDIKEAEMELLASDAELKSAKASFFPSLMLNANLGINAFSSALLFSLPASTAYVAMSMLTAPLLNRQQQKAFFNQAYMAKNESFYQYQKTVLNAVSEVNNAFNRFKNYSEAASLKQQELNAYRQATEVSNQLFVTGYSGYVELLMIRKSLLDSEIELTEANKEKFFAAIMLYRALGGGW